MKNGPKMVNRNIPQKMSDSKGEVSNDCVFNLILFIIIVGRICQEVLLGEAACSFPVAQTQNKQTETMLIAVLFGQ